MKLEDFSYVVALSRDLKPDRPIARTILDEWLVVFRDENGEPVALRDRCMHRNSRLSPGKVRDGRLQCPYHGWEYDRSGQVVAVPAEGEYFQQNSARCAKRYDVCEQDGYVYVRLSNTVDVQPFAMPHYGETGWETVRVINRFENSVVNCAENFIDIPHTVSVHPGVFRVPRRQKLEMLVERIISVGIVGFSIRGVKKFSTLIGILCRISLLWNTIWASIAAVLSPVNRFPKRRIPHWCIPM
jgi:phenylpropionate dioxygenase-like ring-hydroxylating dioxygenase large terminal subunit